MIDQPRPRIYWITWAGSAFRIWCGCLPLRCARAVEMRENKRRRAPEGQRLSRRGARPRRGVAGNPQQVRAVAGEAPAAAALTRQEESHQVPLGEVRLEEVTQAAVHQPPEEALRAAAAQQTAAARQVAAQQLTWMQAA